MHSRRHFLSTLGSATASGFLAEHLTVSGNAPSGPGGQPRGLASPDDFMFSPGLVYLQTGSLGPTPRPVMDRSIAAWKELELNPVYYGYGPHEKAMEDVRDSAAAFIGARKDEVLITRSATEGMNSVAQGLNLSAGDRVAITDQEHPGGRSGWDYVIRKHGVLLDVVPIPLGENDAAAVVARFEKAITPRTRALVFSHVLTSTGFRMPVAELSALARARGCLAVVDGAQAVGGIAVSVKALGCHVYVTCGHKWLLGPPGTGLLYLSEEIGRTIDPIALQGGRNVYCDSSGVTNIPGVLGLAAAIDYVNAIGIAAVERHNLALRDRLYAALQEVPRLRVVSAPPGPRTTPLLTYTLPNAIPSADLMTRLSERHQVVVKVVPGQWMNGNRISTHLFNTPGDVDALVAALRAELR